MQIALNDFCMNLSFIMLSINNDCLACSEKARAQLFKASLA